jgi:hypothetical protein
MPRISKIDRLALQAMEVLSALALDETRPDYIRRPAASAMLRHAKEARGVFISLTSGLH